MDCSRDIDIQIDRLFEMGFAEQLNEIIKKCPVERQTLLFSATMPKMLIQFTRAGLKEPQLVRLESDFKMSDELRCAFFLVRSSEKIAALLYLIRKIIPKGQLTIIFTATRHHSEFLYKLLQLIGERSTLIYGTMDQDARAANLKAFRGGEVSFLIVTDLAARGIDVPLLNNVINFHFPPSPKLFLHRCGRAARQGRIGFALSLVESEELGFAADVHTLLGRAITTGHEESVDGLTYDLSNMTPSDIHCGILPQDCLDEENEFLKKVLGEDDNLSSAFKVSENAMKQFRRTRTEASKDGVKKAKALIKEKVIRFIHPLIKGCDPSRCSKLNIEKADFIQQLQTFRPNQTVFETGIGTSTAQATKYVKDSTGASAMKNFRKEVASSLERNKVCDSGGLQLHSEDGWDDLTEMDDSILQSNDCPTIWRDEYCNDSAEASENTAADEAESMYGEASPVKLRISRAARKKMKKMNMPVRCMRKQGDHDDGLVVSSSVKESYQDPRYYMSYGTEDEKATFNEASMQPKSNLRDRETLGANMLEYALLDIAPDTVDEMNNKRRIMRWDAKKRKFVKQTLEEMAQTKGNKRVRTESGASVKGSKAPAGELYNKWKKRTRREISLLGADESERPKVKINAHVKSELRSAAEIRKLKKEKANVALKNMSRDKRKRIESRMKKKKKAMNTSKANVTKAGNRRVKIVVRS